MDAMLAPLTVDDVLPRLRAVLMQLKISYEASPSEEGRKALSLVADLIEDLLDIQESENALRDTDPANLIPWADIDEELGAD